MDFRVCSYALQTGVLRGVVKWHIFHSILSSAANEIEQCIGGIIRDCRECSREFEDLEQLEVGDEKELESLELPRLLLL